MTVTEHIEQRIYIIRGQKVLLDFDLAELYGVSVGRLNEAVGRNIERFPADFMFRLTEAESSNLKSQIAISSSGWGGRRHAPYAFAEQGVAMLSGVLKSPRAIQVNIAIMRAFVKLRELLAGQKDLAKQIEAIKRLLADHQGALGKHGKQIQIAFDLIKRFMEPAVAPKRRIGFLPPEIARG